MATWEYETLWRREARGAERQWWRRPWALSATVVAAWIAQQIADLPVPPLLILPGRAGPVEIHWPEPLLIIWIAWVVARAMHRDRLAGNDEQLAVTPISGEALGLSKSLAPALSAVLALGIVRAVALIGLEWGTVPALGLRPEVGEGLSGVLAYPSAALVYMVLSPLLLALVAGWVSVRVRSVTLAWALSLTAGVALVMVLPLLSALSGIFLGLVVALVMVGVVVWFDMTGFALLVGCALAFYNFGVLVNGSENPIVTILMLIFVGLLLAVVIIGGTEAEIGLFALGGLALQTTLLVAHRHDPAGRVAEQLVTVLHLVVHLWIAWKWLCWVERDFRRLHFARLPR